MKRFLSLFITICIVASAFTALPLTASAVTYTWNVGATSNDHVTATIDYDTNVLTVSGTGAIADNTKSPIYRKFTYETDYLQNTIHKVIIEPGITRIGNHFLESKISLQSVEIPDSVTSIGEFAFYNCSALKELTIPGNMETIESNAFYLCSSLKEIVIPDSVTTIGSNAFYLRSNPDYVIVGKGVKSLGDNAFGKATYVSSVREICAPKNICFLGEEPSISDTSIANLYDCTIYYPSEYDYSRMTALSPKPTYKKHDHYGEEWHIITAPTQSKSGLAEATCSITHNHQFAFKIPSLSNGDVWTSNVTQDSTCSEEGIITYSSDYGEVTESIPTNKDKHNWDDWNIILQPTNSTLGISKRICSSNNKHTELQYLSVLTDSDFWTKGEYIAPTTEADGSQEYISEYGTVTETIPKLTPTPTTTPTASPTASPSAEPTGEPTASPSATPSAEPTSEPTATPSASPSAEPTSEPTATPSASPSAEPTGEPTATPSTEPIIMPTIPPNIDVNSDCIKIMAIYSTDGTLESVSVEKIKVSEIVLSQNTETDKVFYWESLENMKPLAWLYN